MNISWWDQVNTFAWVASNLLIGYIGIALIVFVVGYYLLFHPGATTAGKLIFRFALSLVGVIGLVFISLFINPREGAAWNLYPGDVYWWRPAARFIVYAYVSYTITSLTVLLAVRKWRPGLIQTAPDEDTLVKVRKR